MSNAGFMGEYDDNYFRWELTDTFGGEANYCWVRRGLIHMPNGGKSWKQKACNAARKAAGLAGVRSRRSDFGDTVRYDQGGTVLFVELGECWIAGAAEEIAETKAAATLA